MMRKGKTSSNNQISKRNKFVRALTEKRASTKTSSTSTLRDSMRVRMMPKRRPSKPSKSTDAKICNNHLV